MGEQTLRHGVKMKVLAVLGQRFLVIFSVKSCDFFVRYGLFPPHQKQDSLQHDPDVFLAHHFVLRLLSVR